MRTSVLGLALLSACSIANSVDVCDRVAPEEKEINARTEGRQFVTSARAVAAFPFGGALAVFSSEASGAPDEERIEVRGSVLSPDGTLQRTCTEANELTYAATELAAGELESLNLASIVSPPHQEGTGALVYARDRVGDAQVFAQLIDGSGCPFGPSNRFEPIALDEPTTVGCTLLQGGAVGDETHCVGTVEAVFLGENDRNEFDFVFLWTVVSGERGRRLQQTLRARVVRGRFGSSTFRPNVLDAFGGPIQLLASRSVITASAIDTDEQQFGVAWRENITGDDQATYFQLFNSRLEEVGDRIELGVTNSSTPDAPSIDIARAGDRLLVVWTEQVGEQSQIIGRFVSTQGDAIGSEPFRISEPGSGTVQWPSVARLDDDRGFLVAWMASGFAEHEDQSDTGVRAVALTRDGAPRFVNQTCGQGEFQLNSVTEGSQRLPSLTTLADGSVMAVWSDESAQGADLSRGGVRSRVFRTKDLLPLE